MGNVASCFGGAASAEVGRARNNPIFEPAAEEVLGHSFCYVRSSSAAEIGGGAACAAGDETAFRSISGAAVSANSSAALPVFSAAAGASFPAGFRSSSSFSALPLQLAGGGGGGDAVDRRYFLSGPLESAAISGPLDSVPFSGPLAKKKGGRISGMLRRPSMLRRSFSEKNRPWVVPIRSFNSRRDDGENVQWARGCAGEDRVHVVVSEEHRWLFVGIYDGFNGPEAPEFLVGNLYRNLFNELRDLFWEDGEAGSIAGSEDVRVGKRLWEFLADGDGDKELDLSGSGRFAFSLSKLRNGIGSWRKDGRGMWLPKWRYDFEEKVKDVKDVSDRGSCRRRKKGPVADHGLVLQALSKALEDTETAYLDMTDKVIDCNPELALMGSCLLVVLMRDDDVYVMNVGDSRAIVGQYVPQQCGNGSRSQEDGVDIDKGFVDEFSFEIEGLDRGSMRLGALQLSTDHSTSIAEEVIRIKQEHPDDSDCIVNDRVKGRLKVTRAFGAGYLKQPKWNEGLLEMFRNDYIGTAPYVSCTPSLCHYKLGANDQFIILSSDGLYQYLSNYEVVCHVESFIERFPDGDPAQSLLEELLFRAAKKAGMDFHELLDIPQGDRRKYHDDVTVMVISLEGRIWKSSGKYV